MFLTFLAPAERCNQRCPNCYLTELTGEPVSDFVLRPKDYASFIEQFVDAEIPVLAVNFQGYEVTLPSSWPYVEAAFSVARRHRIDANFITNGMLLHKWAMRVQDLDVHQVVVSIDGATPEINDALRGLPGALDATLASVQSFLRQVPELGHRLSVASILYDGKNFQSLLGMPRLLSVLGIRSWVIGFELGLAGETVRPVLGVASLCDRMLQLREAATACGIECYVSDEFGYLGGLDEPTKERLRPLHVYDARFLYRIDPKGYVRSGFKTLDVWKEDCARRWDPGTDDAVTASGYRESARIFRTRGPRTAFARPHRGSAL